VTLVEEIFHVAPFGMQINFGAAFFFLIPIVSGAEESPLFYRDVLPILQNHCQECHRPGEIGPMPLLTYQEARPWAKAIRDAVTTTQMPPWFADPRYGKFANDRRLSPAEIDTIRAWADCGAPAGSAKEGPPPKVWTVGWTIGTPDAVFAMPQPFPVPASGELSYQYVIVPTGFTADRWVQKVEIRPGDRAVVHHAVVYVRDPNSLWLRDRPAGRTFSLDKPEIAHDDVLFTYTPGNQSDSWPDGMAKLIPAGSDLVFQMHYTPAKKPALDRTRIGVIYAKEPPKKRLLTLQLNSASFLIPPGHPDYHVHVWGTIPNDALLMSLYPHMHLRGKTFEYKLTPPGGQPQVLLKVDDYNFYWQLNYRLAQPIPLPAGSRLDAEATFDNSKNNPRNPDPDVAVRFGEQSTDEMMIGFFDVAVDANIDKTKFFRRGSPKADR
jgi:hypothetical protein